MFPNQGILHVKKRGVAEWLILFVFVMPFLLPALLQLFQLPGVVKYTVDVAWVGLLFAFIFNKQLIVNRKLLPMVVFMCTIAIYTFIVYMFQFQSPFYYLWGVRNNFRFYIATFAAAILFDREDIQTLFRFIEFIFWVNALVSLFQFFVMGYEQDYLGGVFGVERGANASTLLLFCIVVSKAVINYMNMDEKLLSCLAKCVTALLVAVLAELKIFFVFCCVIVLLSAMITRFSWKKVVILLVVLGSVPLVGLLLPVLFGESSNVTVSRIIELITAKNYATAEDLGRFTAIPTIRRVFLTSFPEALFGLGLGNCDTAAFSLCNTPFFQNYGDIHYSWFSSAFLFLETGYVGLMLTLSFFVMTMIISVRVMKKKTGEYKLYGQIGMVMSVICIIMIFYNASLRSEIGYVAYLCLALPWIACKQNAQ